MKNVLAGFVAALVLSWADPAAAQSVTGNRLLERAAAFKRVEAGTATAVDFQNAAYFQGFAAGVVLTLDAIDRQTCIPEESNTGQWVKVLIQYLEANPAELHKAGETLALAAFRKAFPCR